MAGEKGQRRAKDKWREKKWFSIMAPNQLGGKEIALSPAVTDNELIGRKVEVPVSDFTGNFKKSNSKIIFKVTSCAGLKCSTSFDGHLVNDDYIRRMVRRRKERLDIITEIKTTDGFTMALKAVAVTDSKLTATKRADLRAAILDFLNNRTSTMSFYEFARYVIGDEVYSDIVEAVQGIYPLKKIEIRRSQLISSGKEAYEFIEPENTEDQKPPAVEA
ncbi:MAG: 30S ribosomal protein S3ae [Thermoplasmataceae archaeon]